MNYVLILKTAEAELRAWRNLSKERRKEITVHCELTRGRKNRNRYNADEEISYNIKKVFDFIESDLVDCRRVVLDITRESSLSSSETRLLASSDGGYKNWVKKVSDANLKNALIRPTLIINPSEQETEDQYNDNLRSQFTEFSKIFDHISYRVSVVYDTEFLYDIHLLKEEIREYIIGGGNFQIMLDFEYLRPSTAGIQANFGADIVRRIRNIVSDVEIVTVATSFPKDISKIGDDFSDEFRLEEVMLNKEINRIQNSEVIYGDYGSINPERNDLIGGPGIYQRARIDFPTDRNTYYYYRVVPIVDKEKKKLISPRSIMYRQAAKLVVSDSRFSNIPDSWGYRKVIEASDSLPDGSSASFWISARMEMHICRQLDRLRSDPG